MMAWLFLFENRRLLTIFNVSLKERQKESAPRRWWLAGLAVFLCAAAPVRAADLDAGGLTFRDFGTNDNGASFHRGDPMISGGPNVQPSRIVGIDKERGFARIDFPQIRIELGIPLGWQATEDWERGAAWSSDKRFRVFVWRVDFAFEGVKDAEHYAATKSGSMQAHKPGVKAQARRLGDGTYLIVYENVPKGPGDSETRVVFDLVIPKPGQPKEGLLLTLGVPTSEAARGIKLMALLRQNMKITW